MRPLSELIKMPKSQLTKEEEAYLKKYWKLKKVKHASSFIYHSRKLPEEPTNGTN